MYEIKQFKELVSPKLGKNKEILNFDIIEPSAPREVGCVMFKLKMTVKDKDCEAEDVIHLIAKKLPVTDFSKKMYDVDVTFEKEVTFYEEILPVFLAFQQEEGVRDVFDNFAKFYGGRLNLHGNNYMADEDAVILLEDLSVKGFEHSNYEDGFEFEIAKQILQDLAKFHGTMIALKFKKPDVFQKTIRSHCAPFNFVKDNLNSKVFDCIKNLILTFPEYAHLAEKATIFSKINTPTTYREPFATFIHFDLWVNNVMHKIENDGIIKTIFIDFQLYDYRSAVSDVFLLLWTSIQKEILQQHLDYLLKYYHENLLKVLTNYQIDTSGFSYENFERELQIESEYEIGHALLFIFYTRVVTVQEQNEDFSMDVEDIEPEVREMIRFMIGECNRRKWL